MITRLSLIASLMLAIAFPALAGEAKGKGKGLEHAPGQHKDKHGAHDRFAKLAEDLKLTEDQKTKGKPIWEDTEKKMKAVHDDKSLTDAQREDKRKAIHEEGMKKFRAILTPDQQKKLDDMKSEAKAKEHHAKAKGGEKKH